MICFFPKVPARQWVIMAPWWRRWLFARHHDLARSVLKTGMHAIFFDTSGGHKRGDRSIFSVAQYLGNSDLARH